MKFEIYLGTLYMYMCLAKIWDKNAKSFAKTVCDSDIRMLTNLLFFQGKYNTFLTFSCKASLHSQGQWWREWVAKCLPVKLQTIFKKNSCISYSVVSYILQNVYKIFIDQDIHNFPDVSTAYGIENILKITTKMYCWKAFCT